jgi:hypothetical protein
MFTRPSCPPKPRPTPALPRRKPGAGYRAPALRRLGTLADVQGRNYCRYRDWGSCYYYV